MPANLCPQTIVFEWDAAEGEGDDGDVWKVGEGDLDNSDMESGTEGEETQGKKVDK